VWITSSTDQAFKPNAIALGNFDGIHLGHRQVLEPILNQPTTYTSVVTFNPHPREFFSGEKRTLLTPIPEKVELLEAMGVQQLILLPFDRELAALTPSEFVKSILLEQLQVSFVSIGADFRFGKNRAGDANLLKAIANDLGIKVNITSLYQCPAENQAVRISSSLIRLALEQGELDLAQKMLGRAYSLTGIVVTGQKLGRAIGFPTANLNLPQEKFLPKTGVYAVKVLIDQQQQHLGVMNLGTRPTVEGKSTIAEVHLLDWTGDLYGKTITVTLEKFLREETKFSSLEALKAQIAKDCQAAREELMPLSL
jgi:riboflavin kinase/FMN adenylyltransferase